jgi:hypothetical protein
MECDHKSKVLDWAYELKDGQMNQYVSLYGCTECDATSPKPFVSKEKFMRQTIAIVIVTLALDVRLKDYS